VQFDYRLDEVKAEAGADDAVGIASTMIALEQPGAIGIWDTDAPILHKYHQTRVFRLEPDIDQAAIGRVFDRVRQEITEHLEQQARIANQR
jgi:hypothetical protein